MTEFDRSIKTSRDRAHVAIDRACSSPDRDPVAPGLEIISCRSLELQIRDRIIEDEKLDAPLRLGDRSPTPLALEICQVRPERLAHRSASDGPHGRAAQL